MTRINFSPSEFFADIRYSCVDLQKCLHPDGTYSYRPSIFTHTWAQNPPDAIQPMTSSEMLDTPLPLYSKTQLVHIVIGDLMLHIVGPCGADALARFRKGMVQHLGLFSIIAGTFSYLHTDDPAEDFFPTRWGYAGPCFLI